MLGIRQIFFPAEHDLIYPLVVGFCLFVFVLNIFASLKLACAEEFITASCVAQSSTERW